MRLRIKCVKLNYSRTWFTDKLWGIIVILVMFFVLDSQLKTFVSSLVDPNIILISEAFIFPEIIHLYHPFPRYFIEAFSFSKFPAFYTPFKTPFLISKTASTRFG